MILRASFLALFLALSGCSEFVQSLHEENAAIDKDEDKDKDDLDQQHAGYKPRTLNGVSANNTRALDPPVRREYGRRMPIADPDMGRDPASPQASEYHRVTRNDFVDKNSAENSLWDAQGQNNYLFSHNRRRDPGDIVTVDVEKDLRREIQYQLWMTLPPEMRKFKKADVAATDSVKSVAGAPGGDKAADAPKPTANKEAKTADEKNRDAAEEAAKTNITKNGKDDDIVRMEVVENLGNGLVRLSGQKRVIYKGVSRIIEMAGIVNNKDIDDNNRLKSMAFVDMQTQVIQ